MRRSSNNGALDRENAKARKRKKELVELPYSALRILLRPPKWPEGLRRTGPHSALSCPLSRFRAFAVNSNIPIRQSAFTLVEILVALAIMVIVVGCTYGLYIGATKSAARYRARAEVERDARALLRMMGREIRCSCFSTPNETPTVRASSAGTSGSPSLHSPAPALANTPGVTMATRKDRPVYDYLAGPDGRDGSFLQTLTTGGIADPDQPSSGLYNVAYRLDAGRKMIWRRQLDLLEPTDSKAQESSWLCVARGVEAIKCSFFDGKAWTDSWKTDLSTGLPYAVKIEIELTDTEGRVRDYSASINVPPAAGPLAQSTVTTPKVR
jgi:prepilin-type N-terminal cleavage/methylation domain-containing protein